ISLSSPLPSFALSLFSPLIYSPFRLPEWPAPLSFMVVGGHKRVEIIERVRESDKEDMSESTDMVILVLIIGILIAALAYLYNRTQKTEEALALSLKMQREAAIKSEGGKDRVKEAKKVLALLEHYDKKKKTRTDEESSEMSADDKKKKKKRKGKGMFTYEELFNVDKKRSNEFGKVVLSVTEGGYKIPWIEGSGKIIELGPKLVKSMLEPTQRKPHTAARTPCQEIRA
ncbi:hypothetical protein PFISCL1PPCAC_16228, partial [Pristionchus fissidentatus]